jgi:hypothetical protein
MTEQTKAADDKAADDAGRDATAPAEPPKGRVQKLFADLGKIGIITYFVIFLGTWAAFAIAISSGFEVEGAAGSAGTIGAAWVATKVTQPIRIGATIVLAPLITAAWNKLRPPKAPPAGDDA